MTTKKISPEELIGEEIEVTMAKNPSNVGIRGKVIDETKSTIKVQQNEKIKTLLKNEITFKINRTGKIIVGEEIIKRPEDRLRGR